MLPDCSREYLLKKISLATPLASLRLRRSIGKFQFLWAKPNPMPDSRALLALAMIAMIAMLAL